MRDGPKLAKTKECTTPRPMYSASPVFEEGYRCFVSDVVVRGIQSVERAETESAKMLLLARSERLVMVKATGLIHMEVLAGSDYNKQEAVWEPCKLPELKFWASAANLRRYILSAWERRLTIALPTAKMCFPDLPEKGFYTHDPSTADGGFGEHTYARSAGEEMAMYVNLAARRRTGSRNNIDAAVRTMVLGLWKFLVDEDVLRLCIACFGPRATLSHYNITVNRCDELKSREAETPNLFPLIGAYISSHPNAQSRHRKIQSNILLQAKAWFFGPDLSPAAWRYFAAGSRRFVEATLNKVGQANYRDYEGRPRIADIFNLLAASGERYPLTYVMWVLELIPSLRRDWLMAQRESFVRFFRLAGGEAIFAKKKKRLTRFVRGDLILAWDWFMGSDQREDCFTEDAYDGIKTIQKNATWAAIMRSQSAWHAAREERERARREADERAYQLWLTMREETRWSSALETVVIDEVVIAPLTSGLALLEEGRRMDHCVGGEAYFRSAVNGMSRIFHMLGAEEEATMEIVTKDGLNWRVRQVFGVGDASSSKQMWKAAKSVAITYARASKEARKRAERPAG